MAEFFDFIMNHWMLSAAFLVVLILLIINELRQQRLGGHRASPSQAVDLINHQGAVVIDVRDAELFAKGHIIGAHNIPASEFPSKKKQLNKWKNKPLIIVCAMGVNSGRIASQLKKEGRDQVYNLVGGMSNWQSENYPVVKK